MGKTFKNMEEFVNYVHSLSVKDLILSMGYLQEEDFKGSKVKCLFHSEKTPSLQITDNFFKCYGCGAKGDIIKWIEILDDLNFIEATQKLAHFLDCIVEDTNMSNYNAKSKQLNAEWANYKKNLNDALKGPFKDELLKEVRSFFPLEVGYDCKKNYIVFTFTSKSGQVLGFTKRRFDYIGRPNPNKFEPKWEHSNLKDSLVKNCSNIFNLDKAWKEFNKNNRTLIMVEGPRDVAAVMRSGRSNVVSTSGTENFSKNVLNIIAPINKLYLMMDGDEAGVKANIENIKILNQLYPGIILKTKIIPLENGKDPGSMSIDEINDAFINEKDALNWYMENASDENIRTLYHKCNSYILKPYIIESIKKHMCFDYNQTIEWLDIKETQEEKNTDNYLERLKATLGLCDDINIKPLAISEEQAKKILKLRYNIIIK